MTHKIREGRSRCSICGFEAAVPNRLRSHIIDSHNEFQEGPDIGGDIVLRCLVPDCGFSAVCRHRTECRAASYKHYRQRHLVNFIFFCTS